MRVPENIKQRVEAKLRASIKIAESHYNQTFRYPRILYTKRGTTAGTADTRAWEVNFNATLLMENVEDFIARTVPHEMAHLIDSQLNPQNFEGGFQMTRNGRLKRAKRSVHGYTWKAIMLVLGAPTSRCHSYDTANARVKKGRGAKQVWVCRTCGVEMKLGPQRHARMQSGRARYWMRGCGHHAGYDYRGLEGAHPTIVPLPKAADAPPAPKTPAAPSKLAKCKALYIKHSHLGRSQMIGLFQNEAGCTASGAATYYATCKKLYG